MSWTSTKPWTLGRHLSSACRLAPASPAASLLTTRSMWKSLFCFLRPLTFRRGPVQSDIKNTRAAAAANPTWDSIREIFKGLFHDERKIWDDLVATRLSLYSRPDMKRAMSHILALLDPEVYNRNRIPEADWRTLRAPTLVVAAVDHRDVFLDTAMALAKFIPNVR